MSAARDRRARRRDDPSAMSSRSPRSTPPPLRRISPVSSPSSGMRATPTTAPAPTKTLSAHLTCAVPKAVGGIGGASAKAVPPPCRSLPTPKNAGSLTPSDSEVTVCPPPPREACPQTASRASIRARKPPFPPQPSHTPRTPASAEPAALSKSSHLRLTHPNPTMRIPNPITLKVKFPSSCPAGARLAGAVSQHLARRTK